MKPFLPPLAMSVVLVAVAAATRKISDWLRQSLDTRFAPVLLIVLLLGGAAVLAWALLKIRSRRWIRYSTVAIGLAMVALPVLLSERGSPEEAAVEQMHFLFYGFLTLLFYRAYRHSGFGLASPWLALLSATLVGLLDELFQWFLALRTGELFDVLLNSYAALCGGVVGLGLMPVGRTTAARARPLMVLLVTALILCLSSFIDIVHLGHRIVDPEVGSFRSYFSSAKLTEIDRARNRRWQQRPPNRPYRALDRQDYFETEAGEHVRRRNRALREKELRVAGLEQRILDRYYPAFLALDDRYPELPFRFVLAPWDREGILAASAGAAAGYESEAGGGRIWLRPSRAVLWLIAALLAGVLLALGLCYRQPAIDSSAR